MASHDPTDGHSTPSPEPCTPTSPTADDVTPLPTSDEQPPPPKARGPRRLLMGLQRMSSSPSLALMGRTRSSSAVLEYRSGTRASLSCVTLASPGPSATVNYGHSHTSSSSSQDSAGLSTAPTSAGLAPTSADMGCFDLPSRVRVLAQGDLPSHGPHPATVGLPSDVSIAPAGVPVVVTAPAGELLEDPLALRATQAATAAPKRRIDFWGEMPDEIKMSILAYLRPKEIVRCSAVSQRWHRMCFDGQLWAELDASDFYRDIPSASLVKILTSAGPFVRDLNLRGCVQMRDRWPVESKKITDVCRNLEYFSVEGCRIDRPSVHYFLLRNPRLVHVNVSGLAALSNSALKILAQGCPLLELLDVSWCPHVDTAGLQKVVRACARLRDLRAAEVRGFDRPDFLLDLFARNALERLLVPHCPDLDDDGLRLLVEGRDPPVDPLTDRAVVPPRAFRHLDLSRCRGLTDASLARLAPHVPHLEGLRLSQCPALTDAAVLPVVAAAPRLTHLDLEELDLSNAALQALARAPCAPRLRHLNVSYCEALGDAGLLPLLKAAPALRSLELDNTRASDLTLAEAAAQVRARNRAARTGNACGRPVVGLRLVAYDCPNVTWTGVREVLSRNAEFFWRAAGSPAPCYPKEVIGLKCFYGYQQTVQEHTKRVLRGELARATLLERRWADYVVANEEAGAQGAGWRRRRRRAREAERLHADEEEPGRGGRRRARSGGCVVM